MNLSLKGTSLLGSLAILGLLGGCASENPWDSESGAKGKIHLSLETDGDITAAKPLFRSDNGDFSVADYLTVPTADQFEISLVKKDGSYEGHFNSIADFNQQDFAPGAYTLIAYKGEKGSQGFDCPYFEGSTDLTVLPEKTTDINVTAALRNSMIVLDYTDNFKNYMTSWEATIYSSGVTGGITYSSAETKAAFVEPNEVHIALNFTTTEGKSTTVDVGGNFAPLPQCLYHITIDVNGKDTGTAAITVNFSDDTVDEDIVIDLTDELFAIPAPTVETIGFENGSTVDLLESTSSDTALKMNVLSKAGIASALLTINSDSFVAPWGKEIDLCNADEATQKKLAAAGISAIGFFKNPDKLAFLDLTEFGKSLPKGSHSFQLLVTDVNGAIGEPASVLLNSKEIVIDIVDHSILYGSDEAKITLNFNGSDPNAISFKAMDEFGVMQDAEVIRWEAVNQTRAYETKQYLFTLKLEGGTRSKVKFETIFRDKTWASFEVPVITPDYALAADPFAKSVDIKVNANNASELSAIVEHIQFKDQAGKSLTPSAKNANSGILSFSELTPATSYSFKATIDGGETWKDVEFTTESVLGVPNGDFEDVAETINKTINQGGTWTNTTLSSATKYQTTLSMIIQEPTGWHSSNSITCNLSSSNLNSWYVIPSVYNTTLSWLSNQPAAKVFGIGQTAHTSTADVYKNLTPASGANAMVIRNVAWDAAGGNVGNKSQTGNTDFSNYYCPNVPAIGNRSAGYMYLGSASSEGAAFTGRPTKLKGSYKYTQDSQDTSEKGVVTITLLDGETTLGSGSLELGAVSSYAEFTVPIKYNSNLTFGRKPTTLKIWISSSNKTSDIKTTNYCNKDECCSRGATLFIDNLTFEY